MDSMKIKLAVVFMIVGLSSSCGGQTAETAVPLPTEVVLPATEAPTSAPAAATDTVAPAVEDPAATEAAPAGATVSFANDILPLLNSRCVNCHGGDRVEEGLILKSHAEIMAGSENGAVVTPGDAASSLLVEMVASGDMPKRGPKLTPPQIQLLMNWVNEGALDN